MKIKNFLMISFLAIAGIFGVSSALINKQAEKTSMTEKAEATSVIGNTIYCSNMSYYYLHAFKGDDKPYGWPGKAGSWNEGGYSFDISDKDLTGYSLIFNNYDYAKSSTITYNSSTPFYTSTGAVTNVNEILYMHVKSPAADYAFTYDDTSGQFVLNTVILPKDAEIKFHISNYRDVWCSGQNLTGLNAVRGSDSNYVVSETCSFTFTCSAVAVGQYGDFTYGMSSAVHSPNTVSFSAGDYGTVTSSSISNVAWGSSVTISSNTVTVGGTTVTANADSSTAQYTYAFDSWTGASHGDIVTSNLTITANFTRTTNQYTASVSSDDVDKGTVTGGTTADYGTSVTLRATPKTGYEFLGWKLNGTGSQYTSTTNPLSFTLTENISYTAYFGSATDYTIYFDAGSDYGYYSDVYLYYLDAGGVYNASFPGVKLISTRTHDSFYGGDVSVGTIPADANLVIFSNGSGKQTGNITSGWGSEYTYLLYDPTAGNWHSSSYTLTLNDGDDNDTTYVYGDVSITMPSVSDTPAGHTAEWNTASDGSGTPYSIGSSQTFTDDTELYRYNRIHKHTVTYNQNDESDPDATKEVSNINYDTDHTVLNIGTGEGKVGWNHSYLRNFLRWNTKSNGSGTSYLPGSTLHMGDEDVTLYAIQQWYTFYCSVDGGNTWHTMVTSSEPGYLVQFNPSYSLDLEAGEEILFKYNDGSGEHDFAVSSFTGNYDAETGIKASCQGRVWLKIDDDNEHTPTCYVDEISTNALVVIHNGHELAFPLVSDGDNQFVTNGFLYIRQGDELKREYAGTVYGLYLNNGRDCFSQATPGDAAQCLYTGAYKIYLRRAYGTTGDMNTIDVQPLSDANSYVETAAYYARTFLTSTSSVCENYNSNTASSFASVWADTGDGLEVIFDELIPEVKTGLKSTTYDNNSYVQQFKARYDYILGKYGTDTLNNYLGIQVTPQSAIRDIGFTTIFGDSEESLSTIIIIAASGVALLSITALSVLAIKKRKSKEQE